MESFLDGPGLQDLAVALQQASEREDPHEAGVQMLAKFFGAHFPVLCEVIAETVRVSGHQKLHYWCDVAEMSSLANYHFTLE